VHHHGIDARRVFAKIFPHNCCIFILLGLQWR
jgi:hypothetical protein